MCYNFGFYRREILRSRLRANINSSILILTWETCCKDFRLSIHRKNSFHVLEWRRVFTFIYFLFVQEKTFIFRSENKMLSEIALITANVRPFVLKGSIIAPKRQASSRRFLKWLLECYWSKNHIAWVKRHEVFNDFFSPTDFLKSLKHWDRSLLKNEN